MTSIDGKRFFCFRGFMKSGTNWIGNLVNLHPQISCVGEFHWESLYQTFQRDLRNLPIMQNRNVRMSVRSHLFKMIQQSLVDLADPEATVIGDRTPHTIRPIIIPNAPHITLTRDGRDVLISRIFHLYNFPEVSRVFERFPHMQERLQRFKQDPWYFHGHPEQLLDNEELVTESMRWWREHLESDRAMIKRHKTLRVLSLKYEDFHADVEGQRRRMYEFLEVDPDLAAPIPDNIQPKLHEERPNEFNRKGQIGDWQNYMTAQARRWINDAAGGELRRQGYIESLDW